MPHVQSLLVHYEPWVLVWVNFYIFVKKWCMDFFHMLPKTLFICKNTWTTGNSTSVLKLTSTIVFIRNMLNYIVIQTVIFALFVLTRKHLSYTETLSLPFSQIKQMKEIVTWDVFRGFSEQFCYFCWNEAAFHVLRWRQ